MDDPVVQYRFVDDPKRLAALRKALYQYDLKSLRVVHEMIQEVIYDLEREGPTEPR